MLKLINKLKPSLNILVKLRFMILVVGQRRVDLPHGQIEMLEMQLFRTPPICEMIQNTFDDFHRRAGNHAHLRLIQDDVLIASFAQHWRDLLFHDEVRSRTVSTQMVQRRVRRSAFFEDQLEHSEESMEKIINVVTIRDSGLSDP